MLESSSKDLTLPTPNGVFTFRIGYLAFNGDKILLQYDPKNNYWFITGGRVEFGNTTSETVAREVAEELSLDISKMELAGFIENFFSLDGDNYHEIAVYYRICLPENFELPTKEACGKPIILGWHNLEDLEAIDIKPALTKELWSGFQQGFTHYVQRPD